MTTKLACAQNLATFLISFSVLTGLASADIAVRDSQTADDDFKAEVLASGHTTMSDWLAANDNREISNALKEIFQARTIDAQVAWINRSDKSVDLAAIDRLLDLEVEADWSTEERSVFSTFQARRRELSPLTHGSTDLLLPLAPNFPVDVEALLLNGREIKRPDFATIKFSSRPTRVTMLSNVYAPTTLKLTGFENDWPAIQRRPWVSETCGQISSDRVRAPHRIQVVASERCRDRLNVTSAPGPDRELIEKFGLDRLKTEPLREPVKAKAWVERPWVWAAVGVLAVGAVVAIERNQNQTSIQPVAREGF